MKVAIDALGIHYYGGGRSAILNLFESLFSIDHANEYSIFLTQYEPTLNSASRNVKQHISPVKNRFLSRAWIQLVLPLVVKRYDLVHFTKNLGVFGLSVPTIVTMHDMTTLLYPDFFPAFDVFYWQHIQKRTLHQARKIVTVSKTTAADVSKFYQIPKDRIKVIYNVYSNRFKPASREEIKRVCYRYGIAGDYLLHVGRIDQKKNLTVLVKAFAAFRERSKNDIMLALVGEEYQKSMDFSLYPTIAKLELEEKVIFTGRVPDSDLPPLYSGASVAVFPSHHEGFGLAPVEAMACGVPIIAHSAGAVREVAGDAALVIDEVTTNSIADAIYTVIQDPELHEQLRKRGLTRAMQFKGTKSARELLNLYEEISNQ